MWLNSISHLILVLSIFSASCSVSVTIADLRKKEDSSRYQTKDITTCHGSHIKGIALHISNRSDEDHWTITAPLACAFPNQGQGARMHGLVNEVEVKDKIVLFDLPNVDTPFEYVLASAKEHTALGCILVAPNNNAKQTAIDIVIKSEIHKSIRQGYHPKFDLLEDIQNFPTVVVDLDGGKRLKNSMNLIKGYVKGYGVQFVSEDSIFAPLVVQDNDEL